MNLWTGRRSQHCRNSDDGVSCRNDVWAPVSLYILRILVWPMRPILAVNCRPQSSRMKDLVLSEDSAAGTDWLVERFRWLRFPTALAIRTSSKCCTPVKQTFRHLDLSQARSSQVLAQVCRSATTVPSLYHCTITPWTSSSTLRGWLLLLVTIQYFCRTRESSEADKRQVDNEKRRITLERMTTNRTAITVTGQVSRIKHIIDQSSINIIIIIIIINVIVISVINTHRHNNLTSTSFTWVSRLSSRDLMKHLYGDCSSGIFKGLITFSQPNNTSKSTQHTAHEGKAQSLSTGICYA